MQDAKIIHRPISTCRAIHATDNPAPAIRWYSAWAIHEPGHNAVLEPSDHVIPDTRLFHVATCTVCDGPTEKTMPFPTCPGCSNYAIEGAHVYTCPRWTGPDDTTFDPIDDGDGPCDCSLRTPEGWFKVHAQGAPGCEYSQDSGFTSLDDFEF